MSKNHASRSNQASFEWASERAREEAARREALAKFIRVEGGFVTSVPNRKLLTIEIPKDSALPSKLTAAGYRPIQCGSTMRTMGNGLQQMDVIEIEITGK
jgi:hypothetical protein